MNPPEICPNCGAEVPPNARACPECGSDSETGWNERAAAQNLDLPDEDFDYQEFVKREFGPRKDTGHRIHWFWWMIALGLVLAFLSYLL